MSAWRSASLGKPNMPARAVIQPNGRYARFSTIVDGFTHANYTEKQLWTVFRDEHGVDVANEKIKNAKADLGRFEEALEDIAMQHGPLEAERVKAYLSAKCSKDYDKLVLPEAFRTKDTIVDYEFEIAEHKRHLALMPETGDEDEDFMRDRYIRIIADLEAFVAERNAATDATHARLIAEAGL